MTNSGARTSLSRMSIRAPLSLLALAALAWCDACSTSETIRIGSTGITRRDSLTSRVEELRDAELETKAAFADLDLALHELANADADALESKLDRLERRYSNCSDSVDRTDGRRQAFAGEAENVLATWKRELDSLPSNRARLADEDACAALETRCRSTTASAAKAAALEEPLLATFRSHVLQLKASPKPATASALRGELLDVDRRVAEHARTIDLAIAEAVRCLAATKSND